MRLILIRHGAAYHSIENTIAEEFCRGLTVKGVEQAELLANRLRDGGELADCTVCLCSPILRARQTAEIILPSLPVTSILEEHNLRELMPGVADGLPRSEYETIYGAFDLMAEPYRPFAPEGESWVAFTTRVQQTMLRLAEQYAGKTIVAVSHGGFIALSILMLFAIPRPGTRAWLHPLNTAITEWQVTDGRWCLVRYNDAAHLNQ